jgi:hypothetical protein
MNFDASFILEEWKNIIRGPTFVDFVPFRTERSMQDVTVAIKTTEYKSTDSPLRPLLNVMYCVRASLWIVK